MKNKFIAAALTGVTLASMLAFAPVGASALSSASDAAECAIDLNDIEISSRIWELLFGGKDKEKKGEKDNGGEMMLIPGGSVFGARIKQEHPSVTEDNSALGVLASDIIISIDGAEVYSCSMLRSIVAASEGRELSVVILRNGEKITKNITPEATPGGYRLGLSLRDGAAGIGTLTYIDPDTLAFGGLGHGICDPDSHEVVDITDGEVTGVVLSGVVRGESGKPGELRGILTEKICGSVGANTAAGLFGTLNEAPKEKAAIPVGKQEEVRCGAARIISTVRGTAEAEYDIEITELTSSKDGTKCFKIKVTDPTLLALTGGIVRGMSGSPIIQDGKLIGAVTHVMVADPTEGYGIFIENMLNASQEARNELPKAA